jgi:hypothetical protein
MPIYFPAAASASAGTLSDEVLSVRVRPLRIERPNARGEPDDWAVLIWRALPRVHRFQIWLLCRCTAMLVGLRTVIQTRHGPDR